MLFIPAAGGCFSAIAASFNLGNKKGLFYFAFFDLSIGFERTMKLILIFDHMARHNLILSASKPAPLCRRRLAGLSRTSGWGGCTYWRSECGGGLNAPYLLGCAGDGVDCRYWLSVWNRWINFR